MTVHHAVQAPVTNHQTKFQREQWLMKKPYSHAEAYFSFACPCLGPVLLNLQTRNFCRILWLKQDHLRPLSQEDSHCIRGSHRGMGILSSDAESTQGAHWHFVLILLLPHYQCKLFLLSCCHFSPSLNHHSRDRAPGMNFGKAQSHRTPCKMQCPSWVISFWIGQRALATIFDFDEKK